MTLNIHPTGLGETRLSPRGRNKYRFLAVGIIALLLVAYVTSISNNLRQRAEWKQTTAAIQSLPLDRVRSAAEAFLRKQKTTDKEVGLRELVKAGYLNEEVIRGLGDHEAWFAVDVDETNPNVTLIRVPVSDGTDISLCSDGSILKRAKR